MQKVSKETIHMKLTAFGLNYPAAMIGPAQILILLEDWIEDLGYLTEAQFSAACAEHRRNSKFFPCTADILEAHKIVAAREPVKPRYLALDRGPRPVDFDQTKKVIQLLDEIKKKNPNMSYRDAGKLARRRVSGAA